MNISKKFDRAFQWAGEKMGGEVKTTQSDDFKQLEMEMALRHDGMPAAKFPVPLNGLALTFYHRHGASPKVNGLLRQMGLQAQ